ncbi:lysine exporter protein LysE/YggA [Agrobacterium albertimagni AOL15]|uniref:Lysine exporter protein LysE/YggA n=1 Tax=Agrobacterium albertimagni AOL15 TaxID=1156935 RepID=K2Q1L3_9HYPH|nr:LysE family transporter [Agrobacterium albertimagni]EKF59010.1 lysine exporter protein LysE/YggA [Agrobacterium albertimagni AOL15]
MTAFGILLGIAVAIAIGAMSPGPSFVLVSRISLSNTRLHGLAAAIGMGLGGALFAVLALAGLIALLERVEWLYLVLKVAGGLYLVYLGVMIWRGAAAPLSVGSAEGRSMRSLPGSLALGFVTQISNPKTAVVYASIFAALMPQNPPLMVVLALPPAIFLIEAGWYAIVAIAFSVPRSQRAYLNAKLWVDRLAGAVIGALGLRLIGESLTHLRR